MLISQDEKQQAANLMTFYLYDKMHRLVVKGECEIPLNFAGAEQATICTYTGPGTGIDGCGYTANFNFPSPVLQLVNFYDDYSFRTGTGFNNTNFPAPVGHYSCGKKTGSIVYVPGQDTRLYKAYYYSMRGNLIREVSSNLRGGYDTTETTYSFTDRPSHSTHTHTAQNAPTLTEAYDYTYDHADRLTKVEHTFGGVKQTLLAHAYDELCRLSHTDYHGSSANRLTYSYNTRGWLTAISGNKFSQNLYYNTGNGTPCYNGNISSMTWKAGNETTLRGYKFTYDGLNRMLDAVYGEGTSLTTNANRFTEKVTGYDKNGNILALQRYGQTGASSYGLIDNLTFTLNGNQLNRVDDAVTGSAYNGGFEFKDAVKQANEYAYDANGNLTKDLNKGISEIQYNCLNLPRKVTFTDGSTIEYTYAADGTKLRTKHVINGTTTTTDYCGNVIYENGVQKLLLTEAGYLTLTDSKYHYYLQDHQGNNRVVIDQNGTVEETNHYYPFGGVFANSTSVQPYKYNGKELDTKKGLNWYDYGARHYDAAIGRFHTQDRFAEKYYPMSPYQYGANNPVNCIDVNGDSIIINKENINAFISAIYNGVENANFVMKFNNGVLDPNSFKQQAINSSDFFLKDLYEIATNDKMVEISFSDKNTYQINGKKISEPFGIPYDDNDKDLLYQKESLLRANIPIGNHVQGNLGQTLVPDIALPSGKKSMTSNVQVIINSNGNVKHRTIGLAHEFGHVILYLNNKPFGHTQLGVDNFVYSRATLMSKRLGYDY